MARSFMGVKKKGRGQALIIPVALFLCMLLFLVFGSRNASHSTDEGHVKATLAAIRRGAVNCYATEGFYPPDLTYLEKNYGLILDREKLVIYYEAVGENLMPSILVYEKGKEGPYA